MGVEKFINNKLVEYANDLDKENEMLRAKLRDRNLKINDLFCKLHKVRLAVEQQDAEAVNQCSAESFPGFRGHQGFPGKDEPMLQKTSRPDRDDDVSEARGHEKIG